MCLCSRNIISFLRSQLSFLILNFLLPASTVFFHVLPFLRLTSQCLLCLWRSGQKWMLIARTVRCSASGELLIDKALSVFWSSCLLNAIFSPASSCPEECKRPKARLHSRGDLLKLPLGNATLSEIISAAERSSSINNARTNLGQLGQGDVSNSLPSHGRKTVRKKNKASKVFYEKKQQREIKNRLKGQINISLPQFSISRS